MTLDDRKNENLPSTGRLVISRSESETLALGKAIGHSLKRGDVVLLSGELGAGKTKMVQGIAIGAGAHVPARSPTFVIVNEYPGRVRLSHCDLYRVAGLEVDELALDERLRDGALAVEWPERAGSSLPSDSLLVQIAADAQTDERTIVLTPLGENSARLLAKTMGVFESTTEASAR